MNAAIYARKSTEQKGVAEESKSVTRQVEHARAFAVSKGWHVSDEHIFVDDGISGAEFERRPDFMRLMDTACRSPRPPFQVLVVSEQKSLGRESFETNYRIKQLDQAGVEIFEYGHGLSLTPKNWRDKVMSAVQGGADEAHVERSSERVHEAHSGLARKGYVVGGRVFGYRNVHVFSGVDHHGNPLRSHVDLQVDEAEAAIVRYIFELYASGLGLKAIAKRLTSEDARAPRPFVQRSGRIPPPVRGWSPSTIRAVLARELYRGVKWWNRSRKRDPWRQVNQRPRSSEDWVKAEREDLRIVPEDLWLRVASRRRDVEGKAVRFNSGRLSGRPPKNAVRNLLAGLATCALCGGGLVVETTKRKSGRIAEYVCHRHRHNGTCPNALRVQVAEVNEAVLQAVEEHALTPEAVENVIRLTERDDVLDRQSQLGREWQDCERRLRNLRAAVEDGGDAATLVVRIRELEERGRSIQAELAQLKPLPRLPAKVVQDRLAEWRRLLRASTTQARAVLQHVLQGRLTFTPRPNGDGYDFSGPTRFDRLFSGIVVGRPAFLPSGNTTGTDHIEPGDTLDRDYGRLLERAIGKGLASPPEAERLWTRTVTGQAKAA